MLILAMAFVPLFAGSPSSLDEARTLAQKEGKLLMLDFYTDW
jgi:thiol:disulfide interchange protein